MFPKSGGGELSLCSCCLVRQYPSAADGMRNGHKRRDWATVLGLCFQWSGSNIVGMASQSLLVPNKLVDTIYSFRSPLKRKNFPGDFKWQHL